MRSIESEGETIDQAIEKALAALQVERERVQIEILEDAARGLFGFGGRPARVRATVRAPLGTPVAAGPADVSREAPPRQIPVGGASTADAAQQLLEEILQHLGLGCRVTVQPAADADTIVLAVGGDETGLVIGRRGQTLDALEYLVNRIVGRNGERGSRIVIDVERYRERRQESLEGLARRLGEKAKQTGRVVTLNPMSPRDRRIVHLTLQDDQGITTRSQGSGYYRKVVLVPAEGVPRARPN